MLRIEDLHGGYPRHPVLHGIDLEIADGSRTAILGRNGVGKSTLVKTIVGELAPTGGSITLDGTEITGVAMFERVRLGIAHVPQGRGIFTDLTVMENLQIPVLATKLDDAAERIERMLDEFSLLREFAKKPAGELSGGQLQVLAFARAMLTSPRIIILDEPSEGVQPSIVDQLGEALLKANASTGVAIVLVEQNLGFAARVTDEAVVVNRGVISTRIATSDLESSRQLQKEHLAL